MKLYKKETKRIHNAFGKYHTNWNLFFSNFIEARNDYNETNTLLTIKTKREFTPIFTNSTPIEIILRRIYFKQWIKICNEYNEISSN